MQGTIDEDHAGIAGRDRRRAMTGKPRSRGVREVRSGGAGGEGAERQSRGFRRPVLLAIGVVLAVFAAAAPGQGIDIERPAQREYVLDLANLIDAGDEVRIREIADRTLRDRQVPIVAVTIESMARHGGGGMSLERFAAELFDQWGIGEASDPGGGYGVLLLVSRDDRVARIELGGGWRRDFDRESQRILDQTILPRFHQRRFGAGIVAGVEALAKMAERVPAGTAMSSSAPSVPPPPTPAPGRRASPPPAPDPVNQRVEREGPPPSSAPAPAPRSFPEPMPESHPPMTFPSGGGGRGESSGPNVCATIGACSGIGFILPVIFIVIVFVRILSAAMNRVSSISSLGQVLSERDYHRRRSRGAWDDSFTIRRPTFGVGLPGIIFGGGGLSSSSRHRKGGGFTFGGSSGFRSGSSSRSFGGGSSRRSFGGGRSGGGGASGSW